MRNADLVTFIVQFQLCKFEDSMTIRLSAMVQFYVKALIGFVLGLFHLEMVVAIQNISVPNRPVQMDCNVHLTSTFCFQMLDTNGAARKMEMCSKDARQVGAPVEQ